MQKDAGGDGTVQHDDELCIGCGTCVRTCPYSVPVLLLEKNIAGKCDACKPFRDAGMNPVCVDACIMRCLDFGDLDDLKEKYGSDLVNELPILPSADATNPSLQIRAKESALNTEFREVII
jgi:anaerobic dimethyl sulfoxide reductase subunit B (iron-sulfur subunit)